VTKGPAISFLLLSHLPKKLVKSIYTTADRRPPLGVLDRSDFVVALKFVALAQAGHDFRSVLPNMRVGLPVIHGVLDGKLSSGLQQPNVSTPPTRRSPSTSSRHQLASSSSAAPSAIPAYRRPLPIPPGAGGEHYTAIDHVTLDSPPPRPTPALPPRSTEQIRAQHIELRSPADSFGDLEVRTPEQVRLESQFDGANALPFRTASKLRFKSDVEVEEQVRPHNARSRSRSLAVALC
jgi:hypothetical protein